MVFLMGKRFFIWLFLLAASFCACTKREVPVYTDADVLARSICKVSAFSMDELYGEVLTEENAFVFGASEEEYAELVEEGISFRKLMDDSGLLLYVLKLVSEDAAARFVPRFYAEYEFPPCDPAEKMVVVSSGAYVMFFKSDSEDVDTAEGAFETLMNGVIDFEEELINHG